MLHYTATIDMCVHVPRKQQCRIENRASLVSQAPKQTLESAAAKDMIFYLFPLQKAPIARASSSCIRPGHSKNLKEEKADFVCPFCGIFAFLRF